MRRARAKMDPWCLLVGALVFSLGSVACTRRTHVEGALPIGSVLAAWKASGYDTSAVVKANPDAFGAAFCSRGSVAKLDVVICEYESDAALRAGEQQIQASWAPKPPVTALTVDSTRTLAAIADTTNADHFGRTIAALAHKFLEAH